MTAVDTAWHSSMSKEKKVAGSYMSFTSGYLKGRVKEDKTRSIR